jgi:hypothetical protein
MEVSRDQLKDLVQRLEGRELEPPEGRHLSALLAANEGSARDVVFRLYDEWEERGEEPD